MMQSRRQFVLTSIGVGTVLFSGCVEQSTDDGTGDNEDDVNYDDNRTDSGEDCNQIDMALIDDPPHEPKRPPQPKEDEWDDHYLGKGIDDNSDLSFSQIKLRFHEPGFDQDELNGGSVFKAELITSREEFEELVEPIDNESRDRVNDVNFEDEAIVVVLSGLDSSSVHHEWVRVDKNREEAHVHGYYVRPYIQTRDLSWRASGIVIEKPDEYEFERVWVSLTIAEDRRANFHTDTGMQTVTPEDSNQRDGKSDR